MLQMFILSRTDIINVHRDVFDINFNCLLSQNSSSKNGQTITKECIQCQNGYYLDGGECIFISECVNPLLNQTENIIQCDGDKYLGYSKKSFFNCTKNCVSCKKDDDNNIDCLQCKVGYAKKSDETCIASYKQFTFKNSDGEQITKELMQCDTCQNGYIQKELQNKEGEFHDECVSCSSILNNCNSCSYKYNQFSCTQCIEGNYLQSDGDQQQCNKCSENCSYCIFDFVNYYLPFPESNPQKGKEKREICLKCPTGFGFHYDGKSCVKCKSCDQCYYLVNSKFIYTLGTYFKAFTPQQISDNNLTFDLKCYTQTCSDGCLDQLDSCQTKYSISGCSLCAMQRSDQDKQNGFTCKQCFGDKQMKVLPQPEVSLQNQFCLDICTPACKLCGYDQNLKIQTCFQCQKQGQFQLEYKQAIENLNTLLTSIDKIDYPSQNQIQQHYLFLQENKSTRKCLNCLFGCFQCSQYNVVQNIYQNAIPNDKKTNKQKVEFLVNQYPQYFQLSQFQFPSQDAVIIKNIKNHHIDIVNSVCSKCIAGYQLISPQMKCIKCENNKFCKYSLEKIEYNLTEPKQDQEFLDDQFDLSFGVDWINISNYYKVNQLNIQEIEIVFQLGPRKYYFKNDYSLNLSFMKSGKVLTKAKLKFRGQGALTTFEINNNFSILFFTEVEFTNMIVQINSQKISKIKVIKNKICYIKLENLIYGGFESTNSLLFQQVIFQSPKQKTGSIALLNNISKLKIDQCQFKQNDGSSTDFIYLIDPLFQVQKEDQIDEDEQNLEITITNNLFYQDFQLTKCFVDTKDFGKINLNLNISNNQFLGPTIGCFASVQTSLQIDKLNYLSRNIIISDNYFNLIMLTGYTFIKDTTADYIIFKNNTINGIFLNKVNDQSTTMFSFFQGGIYDTQIAFVNASDSEFYLFELTGTKDQSNIQLCIDPKIYIRNFNTFFPKQPPIFPNYTVNNDNNQNFNKSNQNNQTNNNIRILNYQEISQNFEKESKQNSYRLMQQTKEGDTYPVNSPLSPSGPSGSQEVQYIVQTLNPLFIIRENINNNQKIVQISNVYLKNISISGDSNPLFDFEKVFVVKLQNITIRDSIVFGNIFKIKSNNFTASEIIIDSSQQNFTLFFIESYNLIISNLSFSKEQSQINKLPQLIQLEYPEFDDSGEDKYYKDCDYEECKSSGLKLCKIDISKCIFGKGEKKCDYLSGYKRQCILKSQQQNISDSSNIRDQQQDGNDDIQDSDDEDNKDGSENEGPTPSKLIDDSGECIFDNTIIYEELSYDAGEDYKEVIIKDIIIKDSVMKSVLMNIINPKRNIQKIIIENIQLNNVVFDQEGYNYMESIPLLFNVNSPQSVFIMKNISIIDFYPVDNNPQELGDLKRFIHSFLQIEVVYLFVKSTQIVNVNPSKKFPYSSQLINEAPRFVDFKGQKIYFNNTKFVNTNTLSGGIIRASSSVSSQIQIFNTICSNIYVKKNGGLLYFYSSQGATVNLIIQDSVFRNITANINGGLVDINNLYNKITIDILNTILEDIQSSQSSLMQIKNNDKGYVKFHDVQILESKGANLNDKKQLIDIYKMSFIMINVMIKGIKDYQMLFKFEESYIFLYNLQMIQIEYLLGIVTFQDCRVNIIGLGLQQSKSTYEIKKQDPDDTIRRQVELLSVYCKPVIEFKICKSVQILDTTIFDVQLNSCTNVMISIDLSKSYIYNLVVNQTTADISNYSNQISYDYHILEKSYFLNNKIPQFSRGCVRTQTTKILIKNTIFEGNQLDFGGGIYIEHSNSYTEIDNSEYGTRFLQEENLTQEQIKKPLKKIKKFQNSYIKQKQILRQLTEIDNNIYFLDRSILPTQNMRDYYEKFPVDSINVTANTIDIFNQYNIIYTLFYDSIDIIDGCKFIGNTAESHGGAIYVKKTSSNQTKDQIAVMNSIIKNNIAKINSPGLSCLSSIPHLANNTQMNNTLKGKTMTAYNIAPSQLNIYFQNGTQVQRLQDITSGQTFDQGNLTIEFQNMLDEKIFMNDPIVEQSEKKPQIFLSYGSNKIAVDNFSYEEGTITVTPQQYIYEPGSTVQFVFSSPNIMTPQELENFINDSKVNQYEKIINTSFRNCWIGEVAFTDKKICSICSYGSYSIEDPQSARCKVCPYGAQCPGGKQILLLEGFWSDSSISNEEITQCYRKLENCVGEVENSQTNQREFQPEKNQSLLKSKGPFFPCKEGHIGALCEVCDLKLSLKINQNQGLRNNVSYQSSDGYECEKCQELKYTYIKISFLILLCVVVALVTVYTLISEIQNKIIKNAFKLLGILMIGVNSQYYQIASSLFKILINYTQINLIVYTLDLQVPLQISNILYSIVSPFKFLQTGFDCLLSQAFSQKLIYIKAIGFLLMPILYYVVLLFILAIIEIIKKKLVKSYYFYTACFFIILFSIPSVIQYLALVVSCRQVGSKKYIAADMSLFCYTPEHIRYIKMIVIPGIVIYGILFPALLVCILYFNKDKFEQNMFEMKFGFLYREYKSRVFYWEIIRLIFKEIIFISISLWDEQQEVKALIVALLLIFYYGLLQRVQPFKNIQLNKLEAISTSLNLLAMILALIAKQFQNITTDYLLYTFVIGQNILFFSMIIHRFVIIHLRRIKSFISYFKSKCCLFTKRQQFTREQQSDREISESQLTTNQTKISRQWKIIRLYIQVYQFYKKINKENNMFSSFVIFAFTQAKCDKNIMNEDKSTKESQKNLQQFLRMLIQPQTIQNNNKSIEGKDINYKINGNQTNNFNSHANLKMLQSDYIENVRNFLSVHHKGLYNDDYYSNENMQNYKIQNDGSPNFTPIPILNPFTVNGEYQSQQIIKKEESQIETLKYLQKNSLSTDANKNELQDSKKISVFSYTQSNNHGIQQQLYKSQSGIEMQNQFDLKKEQVQPTELNRLPQIDENQYLMKSAQTQNNSQQRQTNQFPILNKESPHNQIKTNQLSKSYIQNQSSNGYNHGSKRQISDQGIELDFYSTQKQQNSNNTYNKEKQRAISENNHELINVQNFLKKQENQQTQEKIIFMNKQQSVQSNERVSIKNLQTEDKEDIIQFDSDEDIFNQSNISSSKHHRKQNNIHDVFKTSQTYISNGVIPQIVDDNGFEENLQMEKIDSKQQEETNSGEAFIN